MSAHDHEARARYWDLRAAFWEAEAVRDECALAAELADPISLAGRDENLEMTRRHIVQAREQAEMCRGYAREARGFKPAA